MSVWQRIHCIPIIILIIELFVLMLFICPYKSFVICVLVLHLYSVGKYFVNFIAEKKSFILYKYLPVYCYCYCCCLSFWELFLVHYQYHFHSFAIHIRPYKHRIWILGATCLLNKVSLTLCVSVSVFWSYCSCCYCSFLK